MSNPIRVELTENTPELELITSSTEVKLVPPQPIKLELTTNSTGTQAQTSQPIRLELSSDDTILQLTPSPSTEIELQGFAGPFMSDLAAEVDTKVSKAGDTMTGTLTVPGIQFNTSTPSTSSLPGFMSWDTTNNTVKVNIDSQVTLQLGQENHVRVYNRSGATIPNGSPVYVSGSHSHSPEVKLAKGDSMTTAMVIGIATEDIANNSYGMVTSQGLVNDIDTHLFSEGDKLWVSKTTAGALVNVEPSVPHHSDMVGYVTYAHPNQGSIMVNIIPHRSLEGLADVNGTPLTTTGQVPTWNQTNQDFDFTYNITNYVPKSDDTYFYNKTYDDAYGFYDMTFYHDFSDWDTGRGNGPDIYLAALGKDNFTEGWSVEMSPGTGFQTIDYHRNSGPITVGMFKAFDGYTYLSSTGGYGIKKPLQIDALSTNIVGDTSITGNIAATNLSGTNTGDQTITLTGDITGSGTGSFATTLASVGTAGTYTKVTTDAKGRVTSGTTLSAGDIPDISATYLKLNQSSVQTITASPIFNWGTTTRIPFYDASKKLTDSSAFVWDDTNKTLQLTGSSSKYPAIDFYNLTTRGASIYTATGGTNALEIINRQNAPIRFSTNSLIALELDSSRHLKFYNQFGTQWGQIFVQYGGGANAMSLHGSANVNIAINAGNETYGNPFGSGVALASLNDAATANLPFEFRSGGGMHFSDWGGGRLSIAQYTNFAITRADGYVGIWTTSPSYPLEVSPPSTSGSATDYPYSTYFTTSFANIQPYSITAQYDDFTNGSTYCYDWDGDGILYSDFDSHPVGYVDYTTGVVDTTIYSSEQIDWIAYNYTIPVTTVAKINGGLEVTTSASFAGGQAQIASDGSLHLFNDNVKIYNYFGNTFFDVKAPWGSGNSATLNLVGGTNGVSRFWELQGGGSYGSPGFTIYNWATDGSGNQNIYSGWINFHIFDNGNIRMGRTPQSGGWPSTGAADAGYPFQFYLETCEIDFLNNSGTPRIRTNTGAGQFEGDWTASGNLQAAGYKSSDGSSGVTTTCTVKVGGVDKTMTIKNGLITSIA